jgi:hypothetical protein
VYTEIEIFTNINIPTLCRGPPSRNPAGIRGAPHPPERRLPAASPSSSTTPRRHPPHTTRPGSEPHLLPGWNIDGRRAPRLRSAGLTPAKGRAAAPLRQCAALSAPHRPRPHRPTSKKRTGLHGPQNGPKHQASLSARGTTPAPGLRPTCCGLAPRHKGASACSPLHRTQRRALPQFAAPGVQSTPSPHQHNTTHAHILLASRPQFALGRCRTAPLRSCKPLLRALSTAPLRVFRAQPFSPQQGNKRSIQSPACGTAQWSGPGPRACGGATPKRRAHCSAHLRHTAAVGLQHTPSPRSGAPPPTPPKNCSPDFDVCGKLTTNARCCNAAAYPRGSAAGAKAPCGTTAQPWQRSYPAHQ